MGCCRLVGRHTGFRFTVDASPSQVAVLARHAGAARFSYNQCLSMVKDALDARAVDESVAVPWSGFDLINALLEAAQCSGVGAGAPVAVFGVHLA